MPVFWTSQIIEFRAVNLFLSFAGHELSSKESSFEQCRRARFETKALLLFRKRLCGEIRKAKLYPETFSSGAPKLQKVHLRILRGKVCWKIM
jgi:hypothetical protein